MTARALTLRPGPLDRFLQLFSDVKAGEGATALLLLANVFLLLMAYNVIKPVRDTLILAESGAAVRSYASAGQAALLLGIIPLYGSLAARFPRRKLINVVTWFFTGCLGLFYVFARTGTHIGVVFFLWTGIFSVMVIAQFWAFANDVYREEEGKRLFPIIAFGASLGAVLGSGITRLLIGPIGVNQLLLVAAVMLVTSLLITNLVDSRERKRTEAHLPPAASSAELPAITETGEFRIVSAKAAPVPRVEPEAMSKTGAFRLVLSNRYLLLIAILVLLLNWVNTTGEFILGRTILADAAARGVAGSATERQIIGQFASSYQLGVNLLSMVLQLFVVSRILKYLGVRVAVLALPAIALGGYAALAFFPVLGVIRWVKTLENATDYSLNNTARHVLFLPTTREQKYKAKQVVDSFCQRGGDVLSAGLVYVGLNYLGLSTTQFALVNLVLVAVWLGVAMMIGREYQKLSQA